MSASVVEVETVARATTAENETTTVQVGGNDVRSVAVTLPSGSDTSAVTVAKASAPTGNAPEPENEVATYLDVAANESVGDDAELSVTVDATTLESAGIAPADAVVLHYVDGSWTELEPAASTGSGTVTLTATATGLSPFAVGAAATTERDTGGDGGGSDGTIIVGETSVSEDLFDATAQRAAVEFDDPVTGSVTVQPVDTRPDGVNRPDGTVLAAVEITAPDAGTSRASTVEISIPRDAIGADTSATGLQIVRLSETGAPERLDTEVASSESESETVTLIAETPGLSVFAVVRPAAAQTPVSTATQTPTATQTEGVGPGLGVAVAVCALLSAALLAVRRD